MCRLLAFAGLGLVLLSSTQQHYYFALWRCLDYACIKRGETHDEDRFSHPSPGGASIATSEAMGAVSTSAASMFMSTSGSSSVAVTSVGSLKTLSATNPLPESVLRDYMASCKHDFSGRLYRMERNYSDGQDAASHGGLMLMDAFLHPSNQFAYIQFKLQGKRPDGVGFTVGKKQVLFARNVTWNCFWVSPQDPSRLLHTASDSNWQDRTHKGRADDLYQLVIARCDAGNVAAGRLEKPLLMNITATASGKILAHWEKIRVCHEPLSPTPIRSIVCTGTLRIGTNPHSGVVYEPKSMDPYIKNWVEYSLLIGFDMVLIYFEDKDLSPIEDMLRPYIDSNKLVLVRSYFEGVTGHGWSPLLLFQENHCLWRAKGLARYVAHNDVDEWVDLSPQYPNINTYMDRTIGSHDYRAISIPENRWILPGPKRSRGAYDFGIYPCDEICVSLDGNRNKLLMDTERVDGYQVHVIFVPVQNDTTVRTPPRDEIRLVHLRLAHLTITPVGMVVCVENFPGPMMNSTFARFIRERCPMILPNLPKYNEPPPFWRRRRQERVLLGP